MIDLEDADVNSLLDEGIKAGVAPMDLIKEGADSQSDRDPGGSCSRHAVHERPGVSR